MDDPIKDNRLHSLVRYLIKEYADDKDGNPVRTASGDVIYKVRYEFSIDNLKNHLYPEWRYSKLIYKKWRVRPEIYEANHFCRILKEYYILSERNGVYGQWYMTPYNLENAREARYSKRFVEPKWIKAIYVATVLNALAAVSLAVYGVFGNRDNAEYNTTLELLLQEHEETGKMELKIQELRDSLKTIQETDSLAPSSK